MKQKIQTNGKDHNAESVGATETQTENFERFVTKTMTFKKGLKAEVKVTFHFDQKTGSYWNEVNGCQENSDMNIPNWEVEEFKCQNSECGCGLYYNKEKNVMECDRCDYTREVK